MGGVAFFDLDRTLLAVNSATLWLREEVRTGNVRPLEALKAVGWLALYSLGSADMEDAMIATIATLKGRNEQEVARRTEEFYDRVVRAQVRPGALTAIAEHRALGEPVVLLTSSSRYLSSLFVRDLGLDDFLCTLVEVDAAGLFTGRPIGRPCFGAGKVDAAQAYLATRAVSLADCAFYTDSASDVPMLEVVGRPVAVSPDPRLSRIARARGWPVVEWGKPVVSVAPAL
jgi:HAD superfamily hydrolase (TIGR01490 family)